MTAFIDLLFLSRVNLTTDVPLRFYTKLISYFYLDAKKTAHIYANTTLLHLIKQNFSQRSNIHKNRILHSVPDITLLKMWT